MIEIRLNSTLVQFKPIYSVNFTEEGDKSQFHFGSIQTNKTDFKRINDEVISLNSTLVQFKLLQELLGSQY